MIKIEMTKISRGQRYNMISWCHDNNINVSLTNIECLTHFSYIFTVDNEEDAMAFKLRWL